MENIMYWLLEDDSPEMKYSTMTELLDMPMDATEVGRARECLINSDIVKAIMDKFNLNKKWEDYNAFSALAAFGLKFDSITDINAMEHIVSTLRATEIFVMIDGIALGLLQLVSLRFFDSKNHSLLRWLRNTFDYYTFGSHG